LQAKLTGREEQALAVKPTNNPEAYEAYLRGLSLDDRDYFSGKSAGFYEQAVQLDPNFAVAWARLTRADGEIYKDSLPPTKAARGDAAKRALEQAQKLARDSPETLLALGSYQYLILNDPGATKTTLDRVTQMVPNSSEVRWILGTLARNEGHWDQSVAYFEQALALDPRNVLYLTHAALTYIGLRQFPTALKLCDRVLDIKPNDPDVMATKVRIYHAQGNLQEAARLLSGINPRENVSYLLSDHLKLERNYGEGIRMLQARLAQFHYESEEAKVPEQANLALLQTLAGDTAGAKVHAEQACNTEEQLYRKALEQSYKEEREYSELASLSLGLSQLYALLGKKDLALKLAEDGIVLHSRAGTELVVGRPGFEENLAWIQAMFGENSRAISTLAQLLQTPYLGGLYGPPPITRALLRIDPMWDPLRSDPVFQKLCQEKQ
jgi:tetratricopeptide (TPR) repeat protein